MGASLPMDDKMKHKTRVNQLDFSKVTSLFFELCEFVLTFTCFQIKLGVFSSEDCQKRWRLIAGNLRKFRVLKELLAEAAAWRKEQPFNSVIKQGQVSQLI